MKEIYLIRTMNLKGATFNIYDTIRVKESEIVKDSNGKITRAGTFTNCRYFTLSETKKGYSINENEFLPYFATVTEDLPNSVKKHGLTPKVYPNCQLTTYLPNGYLVFRCLDSGEDLKIAMNSHYYTPKN